MIKKPQKGDRSSREEMILVQNLYFKTPFMKFRTSTPEVKQLAAKMGRIDNSIALRLNNYASCDLDLRSRGIKGIYAHIKQFQPYWDEFADNREQLIYESEKVLTEYQGTTIDNKFQKVHADIPAGLTEMMLRTEVMARVNKHFFRDMVLTNFYGKCALSGIDLPEHLMASFNLNIHLLLNSL